jgi:phosphate uptake regulator
MTTDPVTVERDDLERIIARLDRYSAVGTIELDRDHRRALEELRRATRQRPSGTTAAPVTITMDSANGWPNAGAVVRHLRGLE